MRLIRNNGEVGGGRGGGFEVDNVGGGSCRDVLGLRNLQESMMGSLRTTTMTAATATRGEE
jgi:hypothetical protein